MLADHIYAYTYAEGISLGTSDFGRAREISSSGSRDLRVGERADGISQAWVGGVDGSAGPVVGGGIGVFEGPVIACGIRFLLVNNRASNAIMIPAAAIPP